MRVLIGILKYPPDFTGAGLNLHKLYCRIVERGIDQIYVVTSSEVYKEKKANIDGIEIIYVSECTLKEKYNNKLLKMLAIFIGILRTFLIFCKLYKKVDIVHTVGSGWLPSTVSWCAFFARKPVVKEIVLLGADDPLYIKKTKSLLTRYYFLLPFNYAKLIIVLSPPLRKSCIEYGLAKNKIWVRSGPIYLEKFPEEEVEKTYIEGIDFSIPTILWVGIIRERKNIKFLVKAGFHLKGKVQLLFVGPCGEEDYFNEVKLLSERLMRETDNRIKVIFMDRTDDRRRLFLLYRKSYLFWFASHKEGFGYVVAESLVCGTPVVTLPVMGVMKYLITHPEDGEIVDTEDPKYFAEVINKWLYHKKYTRSSISKRAKEKFHSVKIENEHLAKLKSLIEL